LPPGHCRRRTSRVWRGRWLRSGSWPSGPAPAGSTRRARLWRPAVDGGAQPLESFGLDQVIERPDLALARPMDALHADVDFTRSEVG
jgi:hypothetical protein